MTVLGIAGCKQNPELPAMISPYKIDIQQGNVVSQEMVGKLKAGMTRSQVRFALGSPLVVDMFHSDRWDYIYLLQRQGKPDERRRLTVIFDGDKLLRVEGDVVLTDKTQEPEMPATKPPAAEPAAKPAPAKPLPHTAAAEEAAEKRRSRDAGAKPETPVAEKPAAEVAKGRTDRIRRPDRCGEADAKRPTGGNAAKTDAAKRTTKRRRPRNAVFGRMLDKIGL